MIKKRTKNKILAFSLIFTMGSLPMVNPYAAVIWAPGTSQSSGPGAVGGGAGETDWSKVAQGAMTIDPSIPKGTVNFTSMEVPDPIVKVADMYTYDFMVHDLEELRKEYSDHMSYRSIGSTYDGRNIYEVTVGNPNAKNHVLIPAAIHAREYITTNLVMKQIEYALYYYDTGGWDGNRLSDMFEDTCLHFVPMANPDGVSISQFGLDGIRNEELREGIEKIYADDLAAGRTADPLDKYLVRWKANARGVNLNQNFDANWLEAKGSAEVPSYSYYSGAYPESELESSALARLFRSRSYKAVINYHSMGEVIYWDIENNKVREKSRFLANNMLALTGYQMLYSGEGGGFKDYVQLYGSGTPSVTLEVGKGEAPVPSEQMESIWAQNKFVWLYALKYAAEGYYQY